jgi:hypothetical protein
MEYPLVIKPLDGVGGEGVCRVDAYRNLQTQLSHLRRITSQDRILIQTYVAGTPVSASVLTDGERCLPLSLNLQFIEDGAHLLYSGGQIPFHHPAELQALELACTAVRLIHGLKGYVGVDMVLTDDSPQLIEVNPRPTTSFVGLRQVCSANLAQAIWGACVEGIMPAGISLSGPVLVTKDDIQTWNLPGAQ